MDQTPETAGGSDGKAPNHPRRGTEQQHKEADPLNVGDTVLIKNGHRNKPLRGDSMSKVREKRSTSKSGLFFMKCER